MSVHERILAKLSFDDFYFAHQSKKTHYNEFLRATPPRASKLCKHLAAANDPQTELSSTMFPTTFTRAVPSSWDRGISPSADAAETEITPLPETPGLAGDPNNGADTPLLGLEAGNAPPHFCFAPVPQRPIQARPLSLPSLPPLLPLPPLPSLPSLSPRGVLCPADLGGDGRLPPKCVLPAVRSPATQAGPMTRTPARTCRSKGLLLLLLLLLRKPDRPGPRQTATAAR